MNITRMTYIHTFRCDKGDKYNMVIVPEQEKKFSLKILNIYIVSCVNH